MAISGQLREFVTGEQPGATSVRRMFKPVWSFNAERTSPA
jgi:hypothetical protein